jgi:hypothetical protein
MKKALIIGVAVFAAIEWTVFLMVIIAWNTIF